MTDHSSPTLAAPAIGSRALFPRLQADVYLNHAAISPFSEPVVRAIATLTDQVAAHGLGALEVSIAARDSARTAFANLLSAAPEDVALVHNTTAGIRAVAFGIDWKPGDTVITFDGEFPANVTPWRQAAHTFGASHIRIPLYDEGPTGALDAAWRDRLLARLEAALSSGPCRVVALSAVQFDTGVRMPLGDIVRAAHAHGALVLVDAIQSCGMVPLDAPASGADFVACGGHKWLMGAEGAGFLWATPEAAQQLIPRMAGWMSDADPFDFLLGDAPALRYDKPIRAGIDHLEGAANSALGYAAAGASIPLIQALGVPTIFAHVQAWHDALAPTLTALGFHSHRSPEPALRSGSVTALPPAGAPLSRIAEVLKAKGVAVSTPNGRLRFAPHWPNALDEVPRVAAALTAACAAHADETT